jgi:hypothetical protein
MDRFMPKQAPMDKLAEAVAIGRAQEQALAVCKGCGLTASESDPVVCTVCGGKVFEILTAEMVESLVKSEGGADDEVSYDGRKLKWTQDARYALRGIDEAYLRRRTRARIEKSARLRRLKTITLEFAQDLIEEETGMPLAVSTAKVAADAESKPEPEPEGKRLVARDEQHNPLFSAFDWTEDATARILRVPTGFMRDRTQARIEELARQDGSQQVDLDRVEAGIELGLQTMAEMVSQQDDGSNPQQSEVPIAAAKCPAVGRVDAQSRESDEAVRGSDRTIRESDRAARGSDPEAPLNEVSPLTELNAMRMLLTNHGESREN